MTRRELQHAHTLAVEAIGKGYDDVSAIAEIMGIRCRTVVLDGRPVEHQQPPHWGTVCFTVERGVVTAATVTPAAA